MKRLHLQTSAAGSAYSASPTRKTHVQRAHRAALRRAVASAAPHRARPDRAPASAGRRRGRSRPRPRDAHQRILERPDHDLLLAEHAVDRERERLAVAPHDDRLRGAPASRRQAEQRASVDERHRLAAALEHARPRVAGRAATARRRPRARVDLEDLLDHRRPARRTLRRRTRTRTRRRWRCVSGTRSVKVVPAPGVGPQRELAAELVDDDALHDVHADPAAAGRAWPGSRVESPGRQSSSSSAASLVRDRAPARARDAPRGRCRGRRRDVELELAARRLERRRSGACPPRACPRRAARRAARSRGRPRCAPGGRSPGRAARRPPCRARRRPRRARARTSCRSLARRPRTMQRHALEQLGDAAPCARAGSRRAGRAAGARSRRAISASVADVGAAARRAAPPRAPAGSASRPAPTAARARRRAARPRRARRRRRAAVGGSSSSALRRAAARSASRRAAPSARRASRASCGAPGRRRRAPSSASRERRASAKASPPGASSVGGTARGSDLHDLGELRPPRSRTVVMLTPCAGARRRGRRSRARTARRPPASALRELLVLGGASFARELGLERERAAAAPGAPPRRARARRARRAAPAGGGRRRACRSASGRDPLLDRARSPSSSDVDRAARGSRPPARSAARSTASIAWAIVDDRLDADHRRRAP